MPHLPCSSLRRLLHWAWMLSAWLLATLLLAAPLLPSLALAQEGGGAPAPTSAPAALQGLLSGRVVAPPAAPPQANPPERSTTAAALAEVRGLRVTLMRFVLNEATGQPEGQTIASTETAADGAFRFTEIPVEARSVLRVLVFWGGGMIRGPLFTLNAEALHVRQTITLPGGAQPSAGRAPEGRPEGAPAPLLPPGGHGGALPPAAEEQAGVRIQESVLILEPRVGQLEATWVLHLRSGRAVSLDAQPLILTPPAGVDNMEAVHLSAPQLQGLWEGGRYQLRGQLPPGPTVVALQLQQSAWNGTLRWTLQHPWPVRMMNVLTPADTLQVRARGFALAPPRPLQGRMYTLRTRRQLSAAAQVQLQIGGIPRPQWTLLLPLPLFFLLLALALRHALKRSP